MSFTNAQQARLLLATTELSPKLTKSTVSQSVEMLDSTTQNDTAKRFVPGLSGGELNIEGWLDTAAWTATQSAIGVLDAFTLNTVASYAPAGFTVGNVVEMAACRRESKYEDGSPVGGLTNFSLNIVGDGPVASGWSLHGITAETADGNGTTVDRGADMASSALGAVAHLHVTAYSGLTSVVFTVQDSANASAWNTIGTFTTVTAGTSERILISGTVRRYLRISWDVTGTGSVTFAAACAAL